MRRRVIFDTNLYISFLLNPESDSAITLLMRKALEGTFVLIVPDGVLEEIARKLSTNPYLQRRIDQDDAREVLAVIGQHAERVDLSSEEIPIIVRDPKDDFLIASALVAEADVLVTGDKDLLVLDGHVGRLRILPPAAFERHLEEEARD